MLKTSPRLLPYEPGYTGHWQAERRRRETREWLRRREMEVAAKRRREAAPSIVPEQPDSAQNQPTASSMRLHKEQ